MIRLRSLSFVGSAAAHVLLFVGLGQLEPSPRLPRPIITSLVELQPLAEPPPPRVPTAEPESPPAATVVAPPKAQPEATPPQAQPAATPQVAPAAAAAAEPLAAPPGPMRLAGLRLSNAGTGGLAVAVGSAAESSAGRAVSPKPAPRSPIPAPKPVRVVPLVNLSRRPAPPNLNAALVRHYPQELKRRGVEGHAMVRLHLAAKGQVRSATLLSESTAGFGEACLRTLRQSEWSPGLDAAGEPVDTQLVYRCRFTVSF